ncbi:MAG: nucleotide sugar dehydrogenase [Ignavibacteria bacterium]|jgi:GDP-mannose 6-dehydrogenase|nr:nucleotide sugar dehydrogenase [Ignavibacteria bacterium]
MNISIFGLGYVGCVSVGCLYKLGNRVIGVDTSKDKVDLVNSGIPTIIEDKIGELMSEGFREGQISATCDHVKAVNDTDVSFICVGTPPSESGHLTMDYIYKVSEQIAEGIKSKNRHHTVVIRSTVIPGTNKRVQEIIQKISRKKINLDFSIVSNPEFLREGNAVDDYLNPSITVVASDSAAGIDVMKKVYKDITAPFREVSIELAEILKFVNNSFHALKITFANEVGNICKKLNINAVDLMELFVQDDKLNISKAYLKPGFAFGGSCLPKDLKALNSIAHDYYLNVPVLRNIERSNIEQKKIVYDLVLKANVKNVGIVGLSFKEGTDDLRDSPIIEVIEKFIGKGINVRVYDENVVVSNIIGANKKFIMSKLPHITSLICNDPDEIIISSDYIIINSGFRKVIDSLLIRKSDIQILDLVYIKELMQLKNYSGLSW